MKSRIKRLTGLGLSLILILSLFGCSSGTAQVADTDPDTPIEEVTFPLKETKELSFITSAPATTTQEPNEKLIFQRLEEQTNVHIDWTCFVDDQFADKKNLALAQFGNLPDGLFTAGMSDYDLLRYAKQGIIIPLENLIDKYMPNLQAVFEKYPEYRTMVTAPDGHIYSFPWIEQLGEGKDIVFLHGYLASKECFAPQIAYFSRRFRVTALDFPGFGQAEPLPAAWSVSDYAAWTKAALSALGVRFPHVIAHSFGGRVAVKLLAEGNAFDRAVLAGCAGIVPRRTPGYRARVRAYRIVRKFAPRYAEKHFGSAEYRQLSPLMRESYKKIVNEDLRAAAADIKNPVLLVYGANDKTTPPSAGEVYRAAIQGSRLEILPGCGHFAFLDDMAAFNALTEEFLEL